MPNLSDEIYFLWNRKNFVETEINVVNCEEYLMLVGLGPNGRAERTYHYYIEYSINGDKIKDEFTTNAKDYEKGATYIELVDKSNPHIRHALVN